MTVRIRRLVAVLIVCALACLGAAGVSASPAVAASKANDPVIFIHGYSADKGDCPGFDVKSYFGALPGVLTNFGWNSSNFHFVGYYRCDNHLTAGNYGYDWLNRYSASGTNFEESGWHSSSACDQTTSTGKQSTNSCDINNFAYHLAWYLWWNFSRYGQTVHLVAHSMGGLIARSALYETPRQTALPPYLLVESVVTLGTPHAGTDVPALWGSDNELEEMQPTSDYIKSLDSVGAPRGRDGTSWTTIGSKGDAFVTTGSANHMCCTAVYNIYYVEENGNPAPGHTNYFDGYWNSFPGSTDFPACWGEPNTTHATDHAEGIAQLVERGLSGVWQQWPGGALHFTC